MVSPRLDVAVVGAGVVGLAIAREVAGRGARVAVFERAGIGAGASGVQPGGVRQQWGTPIACRMARESAAFYSEADERLAAWVPLGFRRCGYLFLAHEEETLQRLAAKRRGASRRKGSGVADRVAGGSRRARPRRSRPPPSPAERGARRTGTSTGRRPWSRPSDTGSTCESARVRALSELDAGAIVVAAGADTPALLPGLPIEREDPVASSTPIRSRSGCSIRWSSRRSAASAAKQLGDGRVLASDLGARGDDSRSGVWRAKRARRDRGAPAGG